MTTKRLAPVATVNAAERAADHARAETIAARPNPPAMAQTLLNQTGQVGSAEQVARGAEMRPLADPAGRIPPDKA